jgi:hypothetical protein
MASATTPQRRSVERIPQIYQRSLPKIAVDTHQQEEKGPDTHISSREMVRQPQQTSKMAPILLCGSPRTLPESGLESRLALQHAQTKPRMDSSGDTHGH